jgi:hypothetical protein
VLVRQDGLRKYPPNLIWIMPAQGAVTTGTSALSLIAPASGSAH